ncbi:hypothetical protein M0805_005017 [Coniferiporia weirii]|nr:hypothetical protein M0805_005017 [Coniferiporia weirii]
MGSPIAETHGPAEIGVFVNVFLFGVMVSQVWTYYSTYQNDPKWLKIYVGVLMLMDTLNTILSCTWIFDLTIMQFGNLEAFANSNWELGCDPAMGGIIAFYCQAFFAWRLKVLTGNRLLAGLVFFFGFCVMIGGLAIAIALGIQPELSEINDFAPIVYVWLVPAVSADIIITVAMTYYLRKRRTSFSRTVDMLNRIIRLTVQSCLLTTLCSLGDLISYLSTPKGYHIGFSMAIPKLYSNAVLSSLNSRPRANDLRGWENQAGGSPAGGLSYSENEENGGSGSVGVVSRASARVRGMGGVGMGTGSLAKGAGGAGEVISLQTQPKRAHTAVFVDVETHVAGDDSSKAGDWGQLDDEESTTQRDSK